MMCLAKIYYWAKTTWLKYYRVYEYNIWLIQYFNMQLILCLLFWHLGNDIDFDSALKTVTIIAGTNSSTVQITVIDDSIVEENETFSMSLTVPTSLGPRISAGNITSATATIIDTSSELKHY